MDIGHQNEIIQIYDSKSPIAIHWRAFERMAVVAELCFKASDLLRFFVGGTDSTRWSR